MPDPETVTVTAPRVRPQVHNSPSQLSQAVSFLTHFLLTWPTMYVIFLTFQRSYQYFLWHSILTSIGAGLLLPEAILVISGETMFTPRLQRNSRVTLHWILHSLGLLALFVGFVVSYVDKDRQHRKHFATQHGELGLYAVGVMGIVALGGPLTLKAREWLYPKVRPIVAKVWHAVTGAGALVLLLYSLINGIAKMRGDDNPGDIGRKLILASYFIGACLVLLRPMKDAILRSQGLMSRGRRQTRQPVQAPVQNQQEFEIVNPSVPPQS